ncbi:MAG TPA: phenylalanine--tRNA ligase subunit beta [Candidatus Saccharimonadales bacterium]|nr:phenylalanine--tRNA ligase subunit beta [Candidatus Saccharimonadales bacterium]
MKVTLNWLKQYVDFNWQPEELTERLTMLGLEVEGVQKLGGEFEGIVVAQVLQKDRHPNADKLWLCRVADGQGERQIVCGAQNFEVGNKVPLILPGSSLPAKPGEQPFTIKVGKIRGVESHGMMCSPQELGLPDQVDGLLLLKPEAKVGQPFVEYLGRSGSDVVYDLEVTPNRPDLNSVIGIAREISALTGNPLKLPEPLASAGSEVDGYVAVRIEDPELCPRYTARVLQGVKIGPSPAWLKASLEKVGVRSISNVVDVTNFVMLETGQPLHAFDYHLIAKGSSGKPTIVVRRAADGEKFTTLDGQARSLTHEMLLIADESKGIALAGVMGGQNTEINNDTKDVLLESAYFKPTNIRRTSKALGLRSESSYRFERGADINICDWASRRAAQLILETAGGNLVPGAVDAHPKPAETKKVTLRFAKTDALLGISVPAEQQSKFLSSLGLSETGRTAETATFEIPTFRVDLKREADLVEEVTRLYGIDKIPSTPPRGAIGSHPYDAIHDHLAEARRILTGMGLNEAQGQTLISEASAMLAAPAENLVPLANPLSSDMNVLRPSLLPGLLDALRHNLARKNSDIPIFEVGRVFVMQNGQVKEERRVAVALTGQRNSNFWSGNDREAKFDVYDLKGVLEEFLEQFGMKGIVYSRRSESTSLLLESGTVQLGKLGIGELGQLLPTLAKNYDLRDPVLVAELNLDMLISKRNPERSFRALPLFPSIRRDVAMLLPEPTTHEAILNVVRQTKPANLEAVELFDVFRGKNVPEGQKSMAYAFTYRGADRTLKDEEVNAAHEKLVEQFKAKLQAVVR